MSRDEISDVTGAAYGRCMSRRRTYTRSELRVIYDRTSAYCSLCHRKVFFSNYGIRGARGSWNVEHSVAVANGGSDRGNNLYAACIECNEDKGTRSARSARATYGQTRAPYSRKRARAIREENTVGGALLGATIGGIVLGPGVLIGGALGGEFGRRKRVK
jgi:hypothetical protein